MPYFWYFAVLNSYWFDKLCPSDIDLEVLEYVTDIYVSDVDSKEIDHSYIKGQKNLRITYKVNFELKENPFISSLKLWKKITYNYNSKSFQDIETEAFV